MLEGGIEVAEWCRKYFQELYNEGYSEEVPNVPTSHCQEEESECAKELTRKPTEKELRG